MSSKTKKMRQQEESIKQAIVRNHRAGLCDSDGNSVLGSGNILVAKPRVTGATSKTYVVRNGKCVEKS